MLESTNLPSEQVPHPDHYLYFTDYVRDVVDYEWLKIIAEDPMVEYACYLMKFDIENTDRSREANILADVAEKWGIKDPENMQLIVDICNNNLVHNYGEA